MLGLETCSIDATYAWVTDARQDSGGAGAAVRTAFAGRQYESISKAEVSATFNRVLDAEKPDVIAIAGWGSVDARACLSWARRNDCRTILMSETRVVDGNRVWWKEMLKSRIVRRFDAALVGAQSHADYLVKLGMPRERIVLGYNTVENEFFERRVGELRVAREQVTTSFFLASNRFVAVKNLVATVDAFAEYQTGGGEWDLCLLGDGPLRDEMVAMAKSRGLDVVEGVPWENADTVKTEPTALAAGSRYEALPTAESSAAEPEASADGSQATTEPGLAPKRLVHGESRRPTVYLPGFRQIDELPEFYARASAFFHPALREPWGLVINEAMASGLPIIASRNGGAVEELVDEGVNGVTFDPADVTEMAAAMARVSGLSQVTREQWGIESKRILAERMPTSAFGEGLKLAIEIASG